MANRGQWDTPAAFVARQSGLVARLEPGALLLQCERWRPAPDASDADPAEAAFLQRLGRPDPLEDRLGEGVLVRMVFEGAAPDVTLIGELPLPGRHNFFLGKDPDGWRTDVPAFAAVRYSGLFPGIDLRVHGEDRLRYDLLLAPGADLDAFSVRCEGVEDLAIDAYGALVMHTALGPLRQTPPTTWEVLPDGTHRPVQSRFRRLGPQRYGFEVPGRDHTLAMVIDPGLEWSTFLGGAGTDVANDIRFDAQGNVVVAGGTFSPDFPVSPGAYDATLARSSDATLAMLSADGSQLLFATYIGGADTETILQVRIKRDGKIVCTGSTKSPDFPTTPGAFDETHAGNRDVFLLSFDSSGAQLHFSTLLGGRGLDRSWALEINESDEITIVGDTRSADFPTTPGAFMESSPGVPDGYVTRFTPDATDLVFSTLVGGADDDFLVDLVPLADGAIVASGATLSTDFPTTAGAFNEMAAGTIPAVVICLSDSGDALIASTYFGSSTGSPLVMLAPDGNLALAGNGSQVPTTPGAYDEASNNIWLAGMSPDLTTLLWCTQFGGPGRGITNESIHDATVGPDGAITIVGETGERDFPTTLGAFDTQFGSIPSDGFVSRLEWGGQRLLYSTFLGMPSGVSQDVSTVVLDGAETALVAGVTSVRSFPTTPGAFDETYNGGTYDVFVSRLLIAHPFEDEGGGVGGAGPAPLLQAEGSLFGGTQVRLDLTGAPPNAFAHLVMGLSELNARLYAGTLVPSFDFLFVGLPTDGAGAISLQGTWPTGLPSGFESWFQYWMPDATAPYGWAASNGLKATAP